MYIYSVHNIIIYHSRIIRGFCGYKLSSLHADEEETDQAIYRHNNVCSVPTIIPQQNHQDSVHCIVLMRRKQSSNLLDTIAVCSVPISIIPQQDYPEHLW